MRRVEIFKNGWQFERNGICRDHIRIPHDWAIEGPFTQNNDCQFTRIVADGETHAQPHYGRTGGLPHVGKAVYRKSFFLSFGNQGKKVRFEFDGIMSHSEIFVNGHKIAERPYGYSSFCGDASDAVRFGAENQLEVHVDNPAFSSRWYPGAGIYREVRMLLLEAEHFLYSGIRIRTEDIDPDKRTAILRVETEASVDDAEIRLETKVGGKSYSVSGVSPLCLAVTGFGLWSADTPELYPVTVTLLKNGEVKDVQTVNCGFRKVEFDARRGLSVNGRPERLKGVCLHHDLGPLGAAFNASAMLHRLCLLKEMGCNAIRTSHNMPDPKLLDLCDELGFYVIDEAFDCWASGKTDNDYHREYPQWHERDLVDFVKRDRNHPCVILWSIGNEINEQNLPEGAAMARELREIVRRFDDRPVTAGIDQSDQAIKNNLAAELDVPGWNYKPQRYEEYHKLLPGKPQYGSETASTVSTRGFYAFPVVEGSRTYECEQCSGYDLEYPPWATTPDTEFQAQEECPWILGEFVWTGFDYLGEPTPYNQNWPVHSSYFGIFDLGGIPKDRMWLYAARWSGKPVLHLLPHWNWPSRLGEITPVHVYTNYPAVELFVNGKSQGTKFPLYGRVRFNEVVYEPGEVVAVAKDASGNELARTEIRTAGEPAAIRISVDRTEMPANEDELAFVMVEAVDADGIPCPQYDGAVRFAVSGAGSYEASANGNPRSLEVFSSPGKHAFFGKCMAVVRAGAASGMLKLTVSAENLPDAECTIEIK